MSESSQVESPESVSLFFKDTTSDKEYRIHLLQRGTGWVVDYQNGRRGSTMAGDTKTKTPVSFEEAKKIYEKLKKEKMKKGYTPHQSGQAYLLTPDDGRNSGVRVQLANSVDDNNVSSLIDDDKYLAQEKHDGERRGLIVDGDNVSGFNRDGLIVPLPEKMVKDVKKLTDKIKNNGRSVFDGEIMGERIVIFDILELDGKDFKDVSLKDRMEVLSKFKDIGCVEIVKTYFTSQDKQALFDACKESLREGVVFKLISGMYTSNKPASGGDWLKFKFLESATLEATPGRNDKRSIGLKTKCGKPVGNVTIPASQEVPAAGDMVEVSYLYFFEGGSLFQPTYKSPRPDKNTADEYSSLKRKNENITDQIDVKNLKSKIKIK